MNSLSQTLQSRLSTESFPIIIGSDCSITQAIMSSLTQAFPDNRIGFLYVDNDADLTLPSETPSRWSSGIVDSMTFSSLTQRKGCLESMKQFSRPDGSPTVTSNNSILFGIDFTGPKAEHFEYLLDNHFRVFSSTAVRTAPFERAKEALQWLEAQVDMIQLHLDVDVIDSGEFPLGNFPSYGGISFDEAMTAVDCFVQS